MNKLMLMASWLMLGFVGCNKKDISMLQKTVEDANQVQLHVVEAFATPLEEQEDPNGYFLDFKIMESKTLDKKVAANLKSILADTSSYAYENRKTCPFMAGYGLSFTDKNQFVNMIISKNNCPKCLIQNSFQEGMLDADIVNTKIYEEIEKVLDSE